MLVLTRKAQESIVVDGEINVTVLEVAKGRVRLGIAAPEHIPVRRPRCGKRGSILQGATGAPRPRSSASNG